MSRGRLRFDVTSAPPAGQPARPRCEARRAPGRRGDARAV